MAAASSPEPGIGRPAGGLSGLIGRALIQRGGAPAPWARQLADAADQFRQAAAELAQQLAPQLAALREWTRSPEMGRIVRGLAAVAEVMERGPSYCVPYDRELARLGLPPLTKEQQHEFVLIAVLLDGRDALELGRRVPLVEVALAAGRHDIAAAIVVERRLTQAEVHRLERANRRQEGELLSDAYLALVESILPSINRRVSQVPMSDVRRIAGPILKQVVRDAYMLKSIRRALVRSLQRETRDVQETAWGEEEPRPHQLSQRPAGDDAELHWDIERALASFLAQPQTSELDRKLVQQLRESPQSSARQIALRLGEPVRTVQYRYRKLVEYVRRQLNA